MTNKLRLYVFKYVGSYGGGIIIYPLHEAEHLRAPEWQRLGSLSKWVSDVRKEKFFDSSYIE